MEGLIPLPKDSIQNIPTPTISTLKGDFTPKCTQLTNKITKKDTSHDLSPCIRTTEGDLFRAIVDSTSKNTTNIQIRTDLASPTRSRIQNPNAIAK